MPAVLNMTALPGHLEKTCGYTSKVLEILGRQFGRDSKIIGSVADAREAVAAFAARIKVEHPDTSFYVSLSVRKGDRKPRGFDDARHDVVGLMHALTTGEPEREGEAPLQVGRACGQQRLLVVVAHARTTTKQTAATSRQVSTALEAACRRSTDIPFHAIVDQRPAA